MTILREVNKLRKCCEPCRVRACKRAEFGEDGVLRNRGARVGEFTGEFAQQSLDTASMLPFAGGTAKGAGAVAKAAGANKTASVLTKAVGAIISSSLTSAGTKTAGVLQRTELEIVAFLTLWHRLRSVG